MTLQNWSLLVAGVVVVAGLWYGATHPKAIIDATKVDVNAIAQAVLSKVEKDMPVGAFPGPDIFEKLFLRGGFDVGGTVAATSSTGASDRLTFAQLNGTSIVYTPHILNVTVNLPASSTIANLVPKSGDMHRVYFRNNSTTTILTTFAAGTGTILEVASTSVASSGFVGAGKGAFLDFWRSSTSTDIYVTLSPAK